MTALTEVIDYKKQGNVAVISSNNPPVNALGFSVRKGLADGIAKSMEDESIKAVLIYCKGRTFFAGADITEFGKPMKEPILGQVLQIIESCHKPVIAAMHGTTFGGGLEIALTCHFRVAIPNSQFGLPEVKLGLLPGAGGTQRLPRVVGVEKALQMITSGNPIGSTEALETGLLDEIVDSDL